MHEEYWLLIDLLLLKLTNQDYLWKGVAEAKVGI